MWLLIMVIWKGTSKIGNLCSAYEPFLGTLVFQKVIYQAGIIDIKVHLLWRFYSGLMILEYMPYWLPIIYILFYFIFNLAVLVNKLSNFRRYLWLNLHWRVSFCFCHILFWLSLCTFLIRWKMWLTCLIIGLINYNFLVNLLIWPRCISMMYIASAFFFFLFSVDVLMKLAGFNFSYQDLIWKILLGLFSPWKMSAYFVGLLVPLVFTLLFRNAKSGKKRGLPVDVGGEPGYAIRNRRFTSPVKSAWEGISTLAELFEQLCKQHRDKHLLGTRKLISRETEVTADGRSFEKVHLGDYEWLTYGKTFEVVCSFASGLAQLGHKREERAAIFADTREEWFIALQVLILNILLNKITSFFWFFLYLI